MNCLIDKILKIENVNAYGGVGEKTDKSRSMLPVLLSSDGCLVEQKLSGWLRFAAYIHGVFDVFT